MFTTPLSIMEWKIFKIYSLLLDKNSLLKNSTYNMTPFRLKIAIHLAYEYLYYTLVSYIYIVVVEESTTEILMVTFGNRAMVDIYFLTSHSHILFEITVNIYCFIIN